MTGRESEENDGPVLILTPLGRDAQVAAAILQEGGFKTRSCQSLATLVEALGQACCAIVTAEALRQSDRRAVSDWVVEQPPWSDFPFILINQRGGSPDPHLNDVLGNVAIIERPFHPATLVSAARSATRARRRQREAEALLQERERAARHQRLLLRELHHRVKNTLATVNGMLSATARSADSFDEFYSSFSARVVALARTQELLTEDYWQKASLRDILSNELAPFDEGEGRRVRLEGPSVELPADIAVPTAMAIHELTMNAIKYGSLSVPEGELDVVWRLRHDKVIHLVLEWRENHGPTVQYPTRNGFGTRLLETVFARQCNAQIETDYAPSGLTFRARIPMEN